MRSATSFLRRIFRRDIFIPATTVRPGDDLIIAPGQLPAGVDPVFFLNALHQQLPGVRLHLITGLSGIQVVRKPHSCDSCGSPDKGMAYPADETEKKTGVSVPEVLCPPEQRPVVVARCFLGPGVYLTLIPPEQEGDAPKNFHFDVRENVGELGFLAPEKAKEPSHA